MEIKQEVHKDGKLDQTRFQEAYEMCICLKYLPSKSDPKGKKPEKQSKPEKITSKKK